MDEQAARLLFAAAHSDRLRQFGEAIAEIGAEYELRAAPDASAARRPNPEFSAEVESLEALHRKRLDAVLRMAKTLQSYAMEPAADVASRLKAMLASAELRTLRRMRSVALPRTHASAVALRRELEEALGGEAAVKRAFNTAHVSPIHRWLGYAPARGEEVQRAVAAYVDELDTRIRHLAANDEAYVRAARIGGAAALQSFAILLASDTAWWNGDADAADDDAIEAAELQYLVAEGADADVDAEPSYNDTTAIEADAAAFDAALAAAVRTRFARAHHVWLVRRRGTRYHVRSVRAHLRYEAEVRAALAAPEAEERAAYVAAMLRGVVLGGRPIIDDDADADVAVAGEAAAAQRFDVQTWRQWLMALARHFQELYYEPESNRLRADVAMRPAPLTVAEWRERVVAGGVGELARIESATYVREAEIASAVFAPTPRFIVADGSSDVFVPIDRDVDSTRVLRLAVELVRTDRLPVTEFPGGAVSWLRRSSVTMPPIDDTPLTPPSADEAPFVAGVAVLTLSDAEVVAGTYVATFGDSAVSFALRVWGTCARDGVRVLLDARGAPLSAYAGGREACRWTQATPLHAPRDARIEELLGAKLCERLRTAGGACNVGCAGFTAALDDMVRDPHTNAILYNVTAELHGVPEDELRARYASYEGAVAHVTRQLRASATRGAEFARAGARVAALADRPLALLDFLSGASPAAAAAVEAGGNAATSLLMRVRERLHTALHELALRGHVLSHRRDATFSVLYAHGVPERVFFDATAEQRLLTRLRRADARERLASTKRAKRNSASATSPLAAALLDAANALRAANVTEPEAAAVRVALSIRNDARPAGTAWMDAHKVRTSLPNAAAPGMSKRGVPYLSADAEFLDDLGDRGAFSAETAARYNARAFFGQ